MVSWAISYRYPVRVVDAGLGSGRFLIDAGRRFTRAALVGIELDPLAALLARANLAATGLAARSRVVVGDYREVTLPRVDGHTLYIGNPPYVRHHQLEHRWKTWLTTMAATQGLEASQLAGLHVHFFLATALNSQKGDFGAFITAAEWLDVNYGRLVRQLFLGGLGGQGITVIEPTANPFPDAATTGAITYFDIGSRPKSVRLKRVSRIEDLTQPNGGYRVRRERLEGAQRWTPLTRAIRKPPEGFVELGELCRVHRGQVTGANKVWIVEDAAAVDLPPSFLFRSVTRARELFQAGQILRDATTLRSVIDLPVDLDAISQDDRRRIEEFLRRARRLGADSGYIARNRKAWWAVGLRTPAPILGTYMARRPPAFVRNLAAARHINIAHGIYPRDAMTDATLTWLTEYLSKSISLAGGRTYAGGLTKFEPKEMERLVVPTPDLLAQQAARGT